MLYFAIPALCKFYQMLIIAWCLLSWFPVSDGSWVGDIAAVLNKLVGLYINIFRRFIPSFAIVDISPIVAILVLSLVEKAFLFFMVV